MKYDTVIFDLDGTLLDTLQDLADSVNYALSTCAFPLRSLEEIRAFVGNGVSKLIARAVPVGTPDSGCTKCLETFRAHYLLNMENKTAPYSGIKPLLEKLNQEGWKLAIVSNKFDGAVKGLAQTYFPDLISVAIGESTGVAKKPAPDTVHKALKELGSDVSCAIYVGDSDVDLETAKNVPLPCVGVTWGFRGREFLLDHGAKYIAENADELYNILHTLT